MRNSAVGAVLGLLLIGALAGCAGPRLESVAGPGLPEIALAQDGIRLVIRPNAWSGFPGDLSRSLTPIAVRIENTRADEAQVRLEDFALLDEGRNQYRALPPAEVARTMADRWAAAPDPMLALGPWHPWGQPLWGSPYWGWGSPYWPGDPYGPYWYSARAGQDIATLGLREGRILPGASVEGFLYFQLATSRGSTVTFSWTPHTAAGAALAPFTTQFRIVR
jgi:hypothetical protein